MLNLNHTADTCILSLVKVKVTNKQLIYLILVLDLSNLGEIWLLMIRSSSSFGILARWYSVSASHDSIQPIPVIFIVIRILHIN